MRSRAEDEAGSVIAGARDEAVTIKAEARAQLAAAQAEITRLRDVQRELGTSLEQSLATLHSVLSSYRRRSACAGCRGQRCGPAAGAVACCRCGDGQRADRPACH